MRARLGRAAPYALLLALAGVLYHIALGIEYIGPRERLGPDFWPRAALALLAVACLFELARSLFATLAPTPEREEPAKPGWPRLAWGMGATVAYVLLVNVLGFFLATAAFLAVFIAIGGYRRWSVVAACAAVGSLLLVVIFMKVVYISLPLGAGPFRALSLGLLALLGVR